jgi:hypothetical protein
MPEKNAPDKLDRYRSHLLEDAKLNSREQEMLSKYRKANSLLCNGYSRHQVTRFLMRDYGLSEPQAYQVVRDSILLYGDVADADKKGMKHLMYENFMRAARKSLGAGDYRAHVKALEQAAKVHGLFQEEAHPFDLEAFMRLKPLVFSTDPKVLKLQQSADSNAEETDYEPIEEE